MEPGRDIGPDEISTLNHDDLEEDIAIEEIDDESHNTQLYNSSYNSIQENNISSLPPGYTRHQIYGTDRVVVTSFIDEPLDETPQNVTAVAAVRSDASLDPDNTLENDPLRKETNRLLTFGSSWPLNAPVRPDDLARNGFYYVGPGDRVICFYCKGVLKGWAPGDIVEVEHRNHFPSCEMNSSSATSGAKSSEPCMHNSDSMGVFPNLNRESNSLSTNRGNLGIVNNRPKHPQFAIESDRLATFNSWPTQMKQHPEDLARAGLFYLGKGDRVKCFCCDGMLHSWEPEDEPMSEHAHWFPDCAFVKLVQQDNSGAKSSAAANHSTTERVETSVAVQALVDNGYSLEAVSKAIERLHMNGASENEIPTATEILKAIMEDDSSPPQTTRSDSLLNGHVNENDKDVTALITENHQLKEQRLCKICLENEISVIFLPCGHLACCAQCATSLSDCPICRTPIKGTARAYWA